MFRRRIASWLWIPTAVFLIPLAIVSFIFFHQHAMIYHPRPYDSGYAVQLPPNGVEIDYSVTSGKCSAYYVPGSEQPPKRVWLAFCGNGSLALDWLASILVNYPNNGDAFLLVDYPGYGRNAGYATIASTRASVDAALRALEKKVQVREQQLSLCAVGHSLGAAVALDFATRHRVQRIVLIAPFTTLREEASTVVGRYLARLLSEDYDNRKSLAQIARRNPESRIAIFHGTNDDVIPFDMGRQLAHEFSSTEFFAVDNADHVTVLALGHDRIVDWMNR